METASINLDLIIDGCRRGNRASQMKLYELFFSYAMSVCLPYARNREEAEEMVNDGFLKVFTRLDQYDGSLPFKPWLRRVMINTAIDYHRKHHKQDSFDELQDYHARELPPITNDALETLEYEDVIALLQQLTPGYRAVFVLYVLEGYSHQDIADELGISVGASKSNLAKARRKLQELLAQKELKKRT
ncbi:MAG: RNA polymerase sigma factor [Bacteroidetes bacterium]|nr:MAG: RNA polymerase sigma factor [Bacteroidota bacterium]